MKVARQIRTTFQIKSCIISYFSSIVEEGLNILMISPRMILKVGVTAPETTEKNRPS